MAADQPSHVSSNRIRNFGAIFNQPKYRIVKSIFVTGQYWLQFELVTRSDMYVS